VEHINSINSSVNRYSKPFFEVFVLSLILIWLPNKLLAYLVPFIAIALFAIRANSGKIFLRLVACCSIFIIAVCLYYFFYSAIGEKFILQNSVLFFLTYGSFLFLFVVSPGFNIQELDYSRYMKVVQVFIVLESVLGIFQVIAYTSINGISIDFGAGDVVQGTLNPFSFLNAEGSLNNQIYTNNLLLLLLFYTPYAISNKKRLWVCIVGLGAVMMASVLHLFIAFIGAVVVTAILFSRSLFKITKGRLLISLVLALAIVLSVIIQPHNFDLISFYAKKIVTNDSPKTIVTVNSFNTLPEEYPWVYTIGLGPGQYSSRAGLIGTGKYFGDFNKPKKMPLIQPAIAAPLNKYIYPHWKEYATNPKYGSSTMSRPFYSILSIIMELGYVISFILLIVFVRTLVKIRKRYNEFLIQKNTLQMLFAFVCAASLIYLLFISFFENYMEVTQAIFPGLLLFRYFYGYINIEQ
jgi:hypothetical protein